VTYPLTNPNFFDGANGWGAIGTPPATLTPLPGDLLQMSDTAAPGISQSIGDWNIGDRLTVSYHVTQTTGAFRSRIVGPSDLYGSSHSDPGIYSDTFEITGDGVHYLRFYAAANGISTIDYMEVKKAMAITSDGFELSVSLVDSGGDQSTLRYQLVAADMTEALAAATTVLSRLDAVTDAVVKGYFVGERYTEDALSLPGSGVQVEQRATVICQIDGDPLKKVAINIPAPVDGLFVGGPGTGDGYNTIDTTDAALALYTDIWAVTGALATISDGEYLSDAPILRGRRTHRQSSRG